MSFFFAAKARRLGLPLRVTCLMTLYRRTKPLFKAIFAVVLADFLGTGAMVRGLDVNAGASIGGE